ncbi:alpha/beta fold hydrolase [Criblamydia sequanensis]|uniref:Alpha/beta hydrolase domain-containing protein n=1 Tax=Candidatus Criblamydia sequanensis CRIB-18 TaxID=1437425 RepID=A0A090D0Z8_9BACT|nr:alpha/beta hydrolase [Criblamydia sequanensis]CDR33243.1 Alpha/beta hydrolase domain-containing protein [Criblamydia sequanensis CRIB-18]
MPYLKLTDKEIYYETEGTLEPLILISGYGCDHTFWSPLLPSLKKKFQVIVFDNPGIGKTIDNGRPFSIEDMAKTVFEIKETLKLEKCHLAGHSMGGSIAMLAASSYGTHFSKTVLLNTSANWSYRSHLALESMLQLRSLDTDIEAIIKVALPWLFGQAFLSNPEKVEEFRKSVYNNPQTLNDQKRQLQALKDFDGRQSLAQIKNPCLLISGTEDLLSLPQDSHLLQKEIANSRLISCKSGHVSVLEIREEIISLLLTFLY